MKKTLLLLTLLFSLHLVEGQVFKGGVRLGFTGSQISGDDLSGFNKMGAYAGGFVNFPIAKNDKWFMQLELNFMMKGSSRFLFADKEGNIPQKYVLTMLYTETPLLVKFRPARWFEAELGPAIGFLCHSSEKDANGVMPARQGFRIFELSGVVGISFIIKEHFGLNLRWSSSLIPVRVPDGKHSQYRISKKQYNDALAFSLYYQF